MAMSGPGIGWYQTRWPKSSKIIGPPSALPPLGAAKMSPGASPGLRVLITTAGGLRSGREANDCSLPCWTWNTVGAGSGPGTPIVKP